MACLIRPFDLEQVRFERIILAAQVKGSELERQFRTSAQRAGFLGLDNHSMGRGSAGNRQRAAEDHVVNHGELNLRAVLGPLAV